MDEILLKNLLRKKEESDWLDFKSKRKLYSADNTLNIEERDELIKDVLGLANGNSGIVRKTKYIIIGADDKKFDDKGTRIIYDVDYKVPSQSEITIWVNAACSPSVVGIECDFVPVDNKTLYVITIPPTFELHETIRELNAKGKFSKFTVFMRQDEHTVPASVRDGVTLEQLKILFRQEVANPPAVLFGAIIGAIVGSIFYNAGINATVELNEITGVLITSVIALFGGIIGAEAGWLFREWNTTRYDWRYWTNIKKVKFIGAISLIFIIVIIALRLVSR
jgi:hypothetical protein